MGLNRDFAPGFTFEFIKLRVLLENAVDKEDTVEVVELVLDDVGGET